VTARQTLLADIGGTTARFAVLRDNALGPIDHIAVSSHHSVGDAISAFLAQRADSGPLGAAILGVAGPVEGGRCRITNSQWVTDVCELRSRFGLRSATLINDFEALAWALPRLTARDVRPLPGGRAVGGEPMVVIGPGTGLGMAALMRRGTDYVVIATEAGHTTLPGSTAREDAVISHLRHRFGHVSMERALSGPGLENLYSALAAIDGVAVESRHAAEITRAALDGSCSICRCAVDMFCALLGAAAGNLALTFRARGGVHIAGGIAPQLADYLAQSEFRARFEAKGRFRSYLGNIPTSLIMNSDAAFLGLQAIAQAAPQQ
jgi:glucokinase